MGQAWCRDRSSKAQDSKSPLDRVFLRCAHRIYPGLKGEGSMLGGATQKVTSSEIGYAGSPPRNLLTHSCSIDSVDRPFQPNDWVDVNLEVPSSPHTSSKMTNLTMDTSFYPRTVQPSNWSNFDDIVPIPPPRKKKQNCPRLSPLKSNDDDGNSHNSNIEPLYSSIIPKRRNNSERNKSQNDERERTKDTYEHKENAMEKIVPSEKVWGWKSAEKISSQLGSPELYSDRVINKSTGSLPNYNELEAFKKRMESAAGSGPTNQMRSQLDLNSSTSETGQIYGIITEQNRNDDVENSVEMTRQLTFGSGNTSTPMKQDGDELRSSTKIDSWFLHADRSRRFSGLQSDKGCENSLNGSSTKDFSDLKSCTSSYLFFDEFKMSHSDLSYSSRNEKKTNSLDRYRELEPKKLYRRTLSGESAPFDSFYENRSGIAPTCHHKSSPKLLTKSISEESFPSALMEDRDEVDFIDDKIVKDTKNEITKIREELEAVKNEVKTPPPSPEPIIKPELQGHDHSTLLKVLKEEADESNLSSMTPSLTELEAALSDMLEKEEDQEEFIVYGCEDDCKPYIISKRLERLIEPNIVPLVADEAPIEIVRIDATNSRAVNNSPTKGDTFSEDFKLTELKFIKNDDVNTPAKPSRIHRINLDSVYNSGSIPTPPRRRNRSKSSGPTDHSASDWHSDDRLI